MIYVDDMRLPATVGRITSRWSHLFSDIGREELNEFADRLGLSRAWIQDKTKFVHYDVTESMRLKAISLGAESVSWRHSADVISKQLES